MTPTPRTLSASVEIAAAPGHVWNVVADLGRTREWSPECRRVVVLGAVRRGVWFVGLNRRKAVVWATLCRVVELDEERVVSWLVQTNRAVWSYRLEEVDAGTRLTETREMPRGGSPFAVWFTRTFLGGQSDHDDELEAGMQRGLEVIKRLAER